MNVLGSGETINTTFDTIIDDNGVCSLRIVWENVPIDPRRLISYIVYYKES